MRSTRAAALWYAEQGWHVFPVWPVWEDRCTCNDPHCKNVGKHPVSFLVPNGHKDATTDADTINAWWDRRPDWNIGTSSHWRVDVDTKDNGRENWKDLLFEQGGHEPTPTCLTPSGGMHLYFQANGDYAKSNREGNLPEGIDMRGEGSGYTLLPPSNHLQGVYQWSKRGHPREVPIAEPPQWLIDIVGKGGPVERAEFVADTKPPAIDDLKVGALTKALLSGDRSRIDICVVTSLVSAGLDDDQIRAIWRVSPPTDKYANKNGQGDDYLALTIGKARAWLANRQHTPQVREAAA